MKRIRNTLKLMMTYNKRTTSVICKKYILKISYTVNDKQLMEKIEAMISGEVRNACGDKEREILMNIWIKELKDIIHNFEKLKKIHPREFNIKMNEIADTIEVFKQKIVK